MRTLDDLKVCRDTSEMDAQPYLEWAVEEIERLRTCLEAAEAGLTTAYLKGRMDEAQERSASTSAA